MEIYIKMRKYINMIINKYGINCDRKDEIKVKRQIIIYIYYMCVILK